VAEKYYRGSFWYWGNIWEFIGRRIGLGGLLGGPQARGRAPVPCCHTAALLPSSPGQVRFFWSKKNHREDFIPFGLRLIFLIFNTQKQGKKKKLALGSRLIG